MNTFGPTTDLYTTLCIITDQSHCHSGRALHRCPQLQPLAPQLWLQCMPVLHSRAQEPGGLAGWLRSSCPGRGDRLWLLANLSAPAAAGLQVAASLLVSRR